MPASRLAAMVCIALVAFAGNSLLCRAALSHTQIDPASFTLIRLASGALVLALMAWPVKPLALGSWRQAWALFVYAAGFSIAYIHLSAGTGALLLFGSVQFTMISVGMLRGERLQLLQWMGLLMAVCGMLVLVLPGLTAPPLISALMMASAGVAWGFYSLWGKQAGNPVAVTAGNFMRSAPLALIMLALNWPNTEVDNRGVALAVLSGALTSGVGYAIWYAVLPFLKSVTAASVQLMVPVIAALGGVLLLSESVSLRLVAAAVLIPGGIALVVLRRNAG